MSKRDGAGIVGEVLGAVVTATLAATALLLPVAALLAVVRFIVWLTVGW